MKACLRCCVVVLLLTVFVFVVEGEMDEVRPGDPTKGVPFWNASSASFMYPPAFDFIDLQPSMAPPGEHGQMAKYRFTLYCADRQVRTFEAAKPWMSLKPVWADVPVGPVTLICEGINPNGATIGLAGMRSFWRTAPFRMDLVRPPAKRNYREAQKLAIDYVFRAQEVTSLVERKGVPRNDLGLNGYPSKTFSSLIRLMARSADSMPERRADALEIARLSAEWLLKNSQKWDKPLAYWPETYASDTNQVCWCPDFRDRIMLIYPAEVGQAYLLMAKATGEARWREAAVRIAETYVKVRRPDGTWPLLLEIATGRELCPNTLVPDGLMAFFEELYQLTGEKRWRVLSDACYEWFETGPCRDWDWEGQFEDTRPRPERYGNLTHHNALNLMLHIIHRYPGDPVKLALARDLIRFAEDQFVHWERPCLPDGRCLRFQGPRYWRGTPPVWHVPGVTEQFDCYVPVDSSAAKLIIAFMTIGKASGNPLDFAKARVLGDKLVNMQRDDGRIPTFWQGQDGSFWLNCQIYDAQVLGELDRMMRNSAGTDTTEYSRD